MIRCQGASADPLSPRTLRASDSVLSSLPPPDAHRVGSRSESGYAALGVFLPETSVHPELRVEWPLPEPRSWKPTPPSGSGVWVDRVRTNAMWREGKLRTIRTSLTHRTMRLLYHYAGHPDTEGAWLHIRLLDRRWPATISLDEPFTIHFRIQLAPLSRSAYEEARNRILSDHHMAPDGSSHKRDR